MRIFITGSTGFVGSEILKRLVQSGHQVRCLVRKGSEQKLATSGGGVEPIHGDVLETADWIDALDGCDAVIHLVGILREFSARQITFERLHVQATKNVVEAVQAHGIKRYLHMSALGARSDAVTGYHRTKFSAEEMVRASGLDYTIFRPSVIFGPKDKFVNLLADMMKKAPFMPVFGDGLYRLQPVAVESVAEGYVKALAMPQTVGKAYEVGGPDQLTYIEILQAIADAIRKKLHIVHVPMGLMQNIASLMGWLPFFPITRDQLIMLQEGNVCNERPFMEEFEIEPLRFKEGIARYLS